VKHTVLMCVIIIGAVFFSGCAGIEPPMPDEVLSHPLGTSSVKIGMTKQQVEQLWGAPNQVNLIENKEKWKGPREEWVYRGQYSSIPIDADYLSKTKRLYFDGNNLTSIVDK